MRCGHKKFFCSASMYAFSTIYFFLFHDDMDVYSWFPLAASALLWVAKRRLLVGQGARPGNTAVHINIKALSTLMSLEFLITCFACIQIWTHVAGCLGCKSFQEDIFYNNKITCDNINIFTLFNFLVMATTMVSFGASLSAFFQSGQQHEEGLDADLAQGAANGL